MELLQEEAGEPWAGWRWIKYGVIALAVFLFLLFMIHPLLGRSKVQLKLKRIIIAISRWYRDLKKGLAAFFAAFLDRGASLKIRKLDAEKLRRIASEIAGGINRKEIKRSVNLFAHLILWGIESIGVPWKPSIPPGEYCALLSAAVKKNFAASGAVTSPEPMNSKKTCEDIIRCAELFEKALYSMKRLTDDEEQEFRLMIKSITGALYGLS
jgi:hypothetical protein